MTIILISGRVPLPCLEAMSDRSSRNASSGGVAAKTSSFARKAISSATNRHLMSGVRSSPLFTSTQRVLSGGRHVRRKASARPTHSQVF